MRDFLKSARWSYYHNVVQAYHGKKKRVNVNVPVYLQRNVFRGNLFSQIKNVDGKLFSWRIIIKHVKGLGVSYISIFVFHLIIDGKRFISLLRNQLKIYEINLRPCARVPMAPSSYPATTICGGKLSGLLPSSVFNSKGNAKVKT